MGPPGSDEGRGGLENGSVRRDGSRHAAGGPCVTGSSGQGHEGGSGPDAGPPSSRGAAHDAEPGPDGGTGPDAGPPSSRDTAHDAESGPGGGTVREVGLPGNTGAGSGGGPPGRALLFRSQRMTAITTASAVAAVMVTNPSAIHWAALTVSPELPGPALCWWISPAVTAPIM